jgi:hypothetical protein
MLSRQKQQIEAYQRVQDFLGMHPPPETPGYLVQKKRFDAIVATLSDHAANQVEGRRQGRAEVPRQVTLRKILREQHLAPIAQIARATLANAPGVERLLRMPRYNLTPLKLVAEATAMRTAAAPYKAEFIEAGRPDDFLEQLDAAAEAVRQSILGKARSLGQQVGAGAGLGEEIKRGRGAVEVMDTIVKAAFHGNQDVLAKWRNIRRVKALPGNGIGRSDVAPASPVQAALAVV